MFVRTYASSRVKRKSFYRKSQLQMFLLISRGHTTFTSAPKRSTNSVLNRVGKSAIFVLNRVRVWGAEPHLPTQDISSTPPPRGGRLQNQERRWIHSHSVGGFALKSSALNLDCSQSPFFSCDRSDIPRLTVTGILIFKCTEGAGVGDYSSDRGEGE